jgi:hypothetical protein
MVLSELPVGDIWPVSLSRFSSIGGNPNGSLLQAMQSDLTTVFELSRSGNSAHLEEALELLQNTVFLFSMTVCGHREDAEDTMQDALLKTIPYLTNSTAQKRSLHGFMQLQRTAVGCPGARVRSRQKSICLWKSSCPMPWNLIILE